MHLYSIGIFENPQKRDSPIHASPILVTINENIIRRTRYSLANDFSIMKIQEIGDCIFDIDNIFLKKSYFFHEPQSFDSCFQTIYVQGRGVVYGKNKLALALRVSFWCFVYFKYQCVSKYRYSITNIFA